MATQTRFENVVDHADQADVNNQPKMYDGISEFAELQWTPVSFKAFGKIMRTTNRLLASAIREYYSKTFHDLRGVNIVYEPSRAQFFTEFFFSKNINQCPSNKIDNLRDLTTISGTDKHSLYYQKQVIENRSMGRHYTINDKTRLLLSDIMFGGRNANKPNAKVWNQPHVIDEITVPTSSLGFNPRAVDILVRVAGGVFDFHRILSKLFGGRMIVETKSFVDDAGNTRNKNISVEAAYEARYIKPVPNEPFVFTMNIEQFDKNGVEELVLKENPVRSLAANGIIYY